MTFPTATGQSDDWRIERLSQTRMSLELCILASGSSGNCTIVRANGGVFLIDAGIGPRLTRQRLTGTGVKLDDIRAICLTHLDSDHFRPSWTRFAAERKIPVFCSDERVSEFRRRTEMACQGQPGATARRFCKLIHGFGARAFQPVRATHVRAIAFDHDEAGSHGFLVESDGARLGWATDLGQVPDHLIERFDDLDILAMESNYDPAMQLASARPWFLKQRIMGGAGHLSNVQAFEAIRRICERAEKRRRRLPTHIVLLHRSRECNCPNLVRHLFSRDPRIADRLTLAEQYRRSEWLRLVCSRPLAGEQLTLAW